MREKEKEEESGKKEKSLENLKLWMRLVNRCGIYIFY